MRRLAALLLATGGALAATAPARADILSGSCQVTVEVLNGSSGTYAVVRVASGFGVPLAGQLDVLVDDLPFKTEDVATTSEQIFAYRVAAPGALVTTCAQFGGNFWLLGDSHRPAADSACQSAEAVLPFKPLERSVPVRLTSDSAAPTRPAPGMLHRLLASEDRRR